MDQLQILGKLDDALKMYNIYLVEANTDLGYDAYDSFVCVARSKRFAKAMHPNGIDIWDYDERLWINMSTNARSMSQGSWTSVSKVSCTLIGAATSKQQPGIICASFNAA